MSRYIDADALTWIVEEYKLAISPITEDQEHDNRLPLQMLTEFENMVAEQPTVDAVPIVRCRECKHNMDDFAWNGEPYKWCELQHQHMTDDFYCADGERRTE